MLDGTVEEISRGINVKQINPTYFKSSSFKGELFRGFEMAVRDRLAPPPISQLSADIIGLELYKHAVTMAFINAGFEVPEQGSCMVDYVYGTIPGSLVLTKENHLDKGNIVIG